ncbi:unnamed protein product [Peronospora destructor]|uniref:Malic enzyme NAD-binding domain-containing protein n=1 Tax=Peronospora destructor TaxID=86335 RepID=A0AAV0V5F8_9STRA|nr:unnamed protein product [Peronospora destructor]
MTGKPISKQNLVFLGAGLAGTGTADLISLAISRDTGKKSGRVPQADIPGGLLRPACQISNGFTSATQMPYALDAPECETFGSPFDPVEINAKLFVPDQSNNSYTFPGVGLGVVASSLTHVDDKIMIIAVKTLASLTTPADLETGCVYPPVSNIQDVSLKVAEAVAKYGFQQVIPKPENITQYLQHFIYNPYL